MSDYSALLREAKGLPRSPLHSFHRYFGKLIPAIPSFAIREFTRPGDAVLDPFCGSGTTLVEAKLLGRDAIGVEINPLAHLVAAVKTTTYDTQRLQQAACTVQQHADRFLQEQRKPALPYCVNMDHWFTPAIQLQLAALRTATLELTDPGEQKFCQAVLSSIIRSVSNADPRHIFPGYSKRLRRLDSDGIKRPQPIKLFAAAAAKRAKMLDVYRRLAPTNCRVILGDARRLEAAGIMPVSLIVTNPPYISSIRYLETMKLEMSWLGMLSGQAEYLSLDRQVVGSERFYKREYDELLSTGISGVDKLADALYTQGERKMSYTVARYFLDLQQSIRGMSKLLCSGGHLVVKISDSHVRGHDVPTHSYFSRIAAQNCLYELASFPDRIGGRSLLTRRNSYSGMIEHDWILIFRKE